jgi:hypothetical protein
MKRVSLLLSFLFLAPIVYGISGDTTLVKDTLTDKKVGFFGLPLLYYTPDTRIAYGAMGVYYFKVRPRSEDEKETRLSYVKLLADYTQNKQLDVWSSWNIFTREERYLFKGDIRYRNFPDRFYGIGNRSQEEDMERYIYNLVSVQLMFMRKVKEGMFVGLDYKFAKEYDFTLDPNGLLAQGNIAGYNGGVGSALGGLITFDTRDNVVNAYEGIFFEASSYFYNQAFGGNFNFVNFNLLFNSYHQVRKNKIIATNTVVRLNQGNVPFLDMAQVGGDDILRGYARNRYRDKNFIGTQVECRFPVYWRFGMTTFAGIGDVFETTNQVALNTLKYSYGFGIRYLASKDERLNIRFDYGFGKGTNTFYIMITEAF